jgi:hypothetical protein
VCNQEELLLNGKEVPKMTNENFFNLFIETAKKAYIEIMGAEKWNSLSDEEKHDAVMMLANGMNKVLA